MAQTFLPLAVPIVLGACFHMPPWGYVIVSLAWGADLVLDTLSARREARTDEA